MGHGTEITFAAIFIYRGLTGSQSVNTIESTLYIACAFFIFSQNIDFAYNLRNDVAYLANYMEGKGGLTHDFHVLCLDYFSKSKIKDVAFFHYFATGFALIIAIAFAALKFHLVNNEFEEDED